MLSPGENVFLQIPGADTLHRGRVIEVAGDVCHAAFDRAAPRPHREQEVLVYHELRGCFVRHAARSRVVEGSRDPVHELELTGPPIPAERRRHGRVPYLQVFDRLVRELVPAGAMRSGPSGASG